MNTHARAERLPGARPPTAMVSSMEDVAVVRRFVLPLEQEAPLAHFFDALFRPHSYRQRAIRAVGVRWSRGAARLIGEEPSTDWTARICALREALASGPLRDAGWGPGSHWILRADDPEAERPTLLAFLFRPGSDRPGAVLKLGGRQAPDRGLRCEAAALRRLTDRGGEEPSSGDTPRILVHRTLGDSEVLLLSALPGRSQYVELLGGERRARAVRQHLLPAARWLARFHLRTRRSGDVWTVPPRSLEPWTGARPRWHERLEAKLARDPLLLSASHGDFWPGNVLSVGLGRVGVVDWEHFRSTAPPFEDLFHYAVTYGLAVPWAGAGPTDPAYAFRRTFLEDNVVSRGVRAYLLRYCGLVGLDPTFLEPLFRLHLLTRRVHAQTPAGGRGAAGTRDPNFWIRCYGMLDRANRSVFSG